MTRQKIQAGATLDIATPDEVAAAVRREIRSWQAEAVLGGRFSRFTANAPVAASSFVIRVDGPEPSFIWDVRRLRIGGMAGADIASIYVNEPSPSTLVASTNDNANALGSGALFVWDRHLVLYPGDDLYIAGAGLVTTTGTISVVGQVQEVPVSQAWRLVG